MYNIHVLLNIIYKGFPTVVENIGEALQYIYIYTFLSEIEGEGGGFGIFEEFILRNILIFSITKELTINDEYEQML